MVPCELKLHFFMTPLCSSTWTIYRALFSLSIAPAPLKPSLISPELFWIILLNSLLLEVWPADQQLQHHRSFLQMQSLKSYPRSAEPNLWSACPRKLRSAGLPDALPPGLWAFSSSPEGLITWLRCCFVSLPSSKPSPFPMDYRLYYSFLCIWGSQITKHFYFAFYLWSHLI